MANGTAALALLPPEHLSKDAPDLASRPTRIEAAIGTATADAVVAISQALVDFEGGGTLAPATKALGGEYLGRVAQLRLDTFGELDPAAFAATALAEGRRVLLQRHGVVLRQHFGAAGVEQAISELVGWAVTIAEKVARDELALQRAWAN